MADVAPGNQAFRAVAATHDIVTRPASLTTENTHKARRGQGYALSVDPLLHLNCVPPSRELIQDREDVLQTNGKTSQDARPDGAPRDDL